MNELFFKEMERAKKRMDKAFRNFFEAPKMLSNLSPGNDVQLFNEPISEVVEKAREVLVKVEMPGLKKGDISLNVRDGMLEVKSESKSEKDTDSVHESSYKGFYRLIKIPTQVKVENANAKYENGLLTVTLPKEHIGAKSLEHKIKVN